MAGKKVRPEHQELSAQELDKLIKYTEDELKADSAPLKVKKDMEPDLDSSDLSSNTTKHESGLSTNQNRLLYLISLYSKPAVSNIEKEVWIRRIPLLVLIYECILLEGLDYDYAPMFTFVHSSKVPLNTSQEGLSDIDYLVEEELLHRLNITTNNFRSTKGFQISESGLERLTLVQQDDRDAINSCVFAPGTFNRLLVTYDNENCVFLLKEDYFAQDSNHNESSTEVVKLYKRESSILDVEEVNYVSSAFIPQCLRGKGRPTFSNAHRAHESAQGQTKIKDALEEIITLSSISLMVAEVIPIGSNNLFSINCNLSSSERVNRGFITDAQDSEPLQTTLKLSTGMTKIEVLDFSPTEFVNVEADIHFPVQDGVIQVETFGISICHTGCVFCGMQLEAVGDKIKDNISLDTITRILIDVNHDSTKIVDSMISTHQRRLLHFIFGDSVAREKITVLIANEITPHLTGAEYLDKGDYENELKQVIGDIRGSYDISDFDILLFGSEGLLLVGPKSRKYEYIVVVYLELSGFNKFIEIVFNRLFNLLNSVQGLRNKIATEQYTPSFQEIFRKELACIGEEICLFKEIVEYIRQGHANLKVLSKPGDDTGLRLYNFLELNQLRSTIDHRIKDIKKGVSTAELYLQNIFVYSQSWSSHQNAIQQDSQLADTKHLLEITKDISRESMNLLKIICLLSAVIFGFSVLDRLTGNWTIINSTWFYRFAEIFILETPLFWFMVSFVCGGITAWSVYRFLSKRSLRHKEFSVRNELNTKINLADFNDYIVVNKSKVVSDSYSITSSRRLRCVVMQRVIEGKNSFKSKHCIMKVSFNVDESNSVLRYFTIRISNEKERNLIALEEKVIDDLKAAGIISKSN